jgi:hypothetical protein
MNTQQALENVFAAEIENRLPFQSKAAIYKRLREQGLVQDMQLVIGSGWSAVTVRGYQLTHAGRITYCSSCEEPADDAAPHTPEIKP